jgi:hypothetical protein
LLRTTLGKGTLRREPDFLLSAKHLALGNVLFSGSVRKRGQTPGTLIRQLKLTPCLGGHVHNGKEHIVRGLLVLVHLRVHQALEFWKSNCKIWLKQSFRVSWERKPKKY